jgi:apolipoprotein N-acyltransferase
MRGIPGRLLGAAALTAVLLDLPFPLAGPLPVWRTVFAWFALAPLIWGVLRLPVYAPGHRRRWYLGWSLLGGWLAGALWFGSNCYWVYNTMHLYGGMNEPMAVLCLVAFSIYLGFWFGAFALALVVVRQGTSGTRFAWVGLAAVPFLWVAMEFALARIPGFPWDLLGYSQVDNGLLMRLAPWTGVYGISFVVAGVNGLLAAGLVLERSRGRFSVRGYCGLLGVLVALVGSAGLFMKTPQPAAEATAVLVQPNLNVVKDDVWVGTEWDRRMAQFEGLVAHSCKDAIAGMPETGAPMAAFPCGVGGPDLKLIVWPESPAPFREPDPKFRDSMAAVAKTAPVIVGNIGMEDDAATHETHIYNSASVFATDGHVVGRYDKMHLVPFGEYVPHRELFFFMRQIATSLTDMSVGSERKVFRIGSADGGAHRYGVFICYESVFGDEIRQFARLGAEVLVNISDDGWYGDTSAPWQHLNMARMRAIENRRWILRDTNNGVTASIDPYGTVRQSIPRHQVDALAARFGYGTEMTFYTEHGDWLAMVCAVLSLGMTGWAMRALLYR